MRPIDLSIDQTVAFVLTQILTPHVRILDVGCGNGLLASRLQEHGHEVVAIDDSVESVQQARALGVDARVAAWPSYTDAQFDLVLFARSLHHIHPLNEAVEQAHRLLVPSGLVIVDDFAWTEIDPVTAAWFYGVVRILSSCQALAEKEDSFVAELMQSGGKFEFWQNSHDHDLHTVETMWAALQSYFQPLHNASVPHLYRFLCPLLAEDEKGYTIVSEVLEMEQQLGQLDAIKLIGHHFVGRK